MIIYNVGCTEHVKLIAISRAISGECSQIQLWLMSRHWSCFCLFEDFRDGGILQLA